MAGIDIGVDNLAAVTANKPGFIPILVNSRLLKSTNQYYNKSMAALQSEQAQQGHPKRRTAKMDSLTEKRNRRVKHTLHCASKDSIEALTSAGIDTIVIGKNKNWKQEVNIGKQNNQQFVQIPHARFIDMLTYKAKLAGIKVVVQEESYTSKCSFLDLEDVCKHETYLGKRVKRGLFRSGEGVLINADVNGSLNIIRKAFPKVFSKDEIEGVVVRPVCVSLKAVQQTKKGNVNICLLNC
jgi:putative transposase